MDNKVTHLNRAQLTVADAPDEQIYETLDYRMFRGIIGNRPINKSHLKRLQASILQRNMLAQKPILVNERMEVVDGQHRLKAAQELGVAIYYRIIEDAQLQEIQLLNAYARPWQTGDYLDSYVALGKKEYIEVAEFAEEYRISISIAIHLLSGEINNKNTLIRFREGRFQVKDRVKAEIVASLIGEVREHSPDRAFAHTYCVRALWIMSDQIDPKLFTNSLRQFQQVVTKRQSTQDYLRQFENIISSGAGTTVELR